MIEMTRACRRFKRDERHEDSLIQSLSLTKVIRSTKVTSLAGGLALVCAPFNMIEQKGQAVTTVSAPVARSCLNLTSLMREPGTSSLSAKSNPPPAPQQKGFPLF